MSNDFELITPQPQVSKLLGPFYSKTENDQLLIGLRTRPEHSRSPMGHVGGGILVNACDFAMGFVLGKQIFTVQTDIVNVTTVNISADFISSPKVGEWLEVRARVLRIGKRICFCDSELYAPNEKLVMRANATFTIIEPQKNGNT